MARAAFGPLGSTVIRLWHSLRGTIWLQLIALAAIAITIHWTLFSSGSGCIAWGNFSLPCTEEQYRLYGPLLSAWNPYQYMGGPVAIPFETVLAQLAVLNVVGGLASFSGPQGAASAYAVLTTIWVGFTFSLFSRSFVRSYWGQFAGAVLAAAGPFQLQMLGQGDYGQFVAEGLVFLSIYFLWRAIGDRDRRWVFYPASLVALLLSFEMVQIFLVGLVLYVAAFLTFTIVLPTGPLRARFLSAGGLAVRFLALPLLLAPVILPAVLSPSLSLAPSSPYAAPLSTFSTFSATPWAVFFGLGYPSGAGTQLTNFQGWTYVASATNRIVADVWLLLILVGVTLVWLLALLFRDRRAYVLFVVSVIGSLLGSGTTGPLGGFNSYLYTHLVGYQELNASYFWDWILVVPVFLLALGILVERLESRYRSAARGRPFPRNTPEPLSRRRAVREWAHRLTPFRGGPRVVVTGLALLFAVLFVLPYSVGAQNGPIQEAPVGVQVFHYPSDYAQIPAELSQLTGATYAGVAVFNPGSTWKWQTSGSVVPSYFYYFPVGRTPTTPGYAQPPYSTSFYAYWVYQEFYSNATKYVGPLFASVGVGYLLVFYNAEPSLSYQFPFVQGQNASDLMRYQVGIVPVVEKSDYAIYRNTFFSDSAASLTHVSIAAGGYAELNAMAYAGVNLSAQAVLFPSDIPSDQCGRYLELASRVYAASANALDGLALRCIANSSVDPVTMLARGTAVTNGWSSSYSTLGGALGRPGVVDWPVPLAVTQGGTHTLSLTVDEGSCASCRFWLPVRLFSDGGSLTFGWKGSTWTLATDRPHDDTFNAMVWVQLPFGPGGGTGTLTVTSRFGWNAIGTVYAASPGELSTWLDSLETSRSIVLAQPGETLTVPVPPGVKAASFYCSFGTPNALDARGLCVTANATHSVVTNVSVPTNRSGSISLLVRANGSVTVRLGGSTGPLLGFEGLATGSNDSWGWIRVPFVPGATVPNDTLTLWVIGGNLSISELVFVPTGFYPPVSVVNPAPSLSIASTDLAPVVTAFRMNVTDLADGEQQLNGAIGYGPVVAGETLATVTLNRTPPGASDIAVRYTVPTGLRIEFDGILVGGNSSAEDSLFSLAFLTQNRPGLPTTSVLSLVASDPVPATDLAFSLEIEAVSIPQVSPVSDLAPGAPWSVSVRSTGYDLSGAPTDLLLVRVPYYPSLTLTGNAGTLASAYGAVDSLILDATNATAFSVEPAAVRNLTLGYAIMAGTVLGWVAIEFGWERHRRTRAAAERRKPAPGT